MRRISYSAVQSAGVKGVKGKPQCTELYTIVQCIVQLYTLHVRVVQSSEVQCSVV